MGKYTMHVYGADGSCGRVYLVEEISQIKARARAKALYWDDTQVAAVAVEWVKSYRDT